MAQIGKTFRIFVSSTFSDLKQERNAKPRRGKIKEQGDEQA